MAFPRLQRSQHEDHRRLRLAGGSAEQQMRCFRPWRVGEARQIEAGMDDVMLIRAAQMIGDANIAHRLADVDESACEPGGKAFSSQEGQLLAVADMHERQDVHAMHDAGDVGLLGGKAADDAGLALVRVHDVGPPVAHEAGELPECGNVTGRRNPVDERVRSAHRIHDLHDRRMVVRVDHRADRVELEAERFDERAVKLRRRDQRIRTTVLGRARLHSDRKQPALRAQNISPWDHR